MEVLYVLWPPNSYSFWSSPEAQNFALQTRKKFSVHCDFWAKLYKQPTATFKSLPFCFIFMLNASTKKQRIFS